VAKAGKRRSRRTARRAAPAASTVHTLEAVSLAVGPPTADLNLTHQQADHHLEVASSRPTKKRRRSKQDRVRPIAREVFPTGVAGFTPTEIYKKIADVMRLRCLDVPDKSTVWRAVGLKKS
jgi:hypothetical protein